MTGEIDRHCDRANWNEQTGQSDWADNLGDQFGRSYFKPDPFLKIFPFFFWKLI